MAKFYGTGVLTGKSGNKVYAVRYGETIERQYQPVVTNPSTEKQVEARAKMKLMSQMSAVFAPIIAMPREGAVSARNQFSKLNYKNLSYANNQAQIDFSSVRITKSIIGMPGISAQRVEGNVSCSLGVGTSAVNRVVYAVFAKNPDNTIRFVGSAIANAAGPNNNWPATISTGGAGSSVTFFVYAYGVKDLSDRARAVYGDMVAETAETFAKLVVERTLTESDIQLTESKYAEVATA